MAARIVARERRVFTTALGVPIAPHADLAETSCSDLIVIGDLDLTDGIPPAGRWGPEIQWLREEWERGAVICSVCTGAVLLAETGLLDGVEATTHWSAASLFREHYSAVRLRSERILSPAGPEHRLVTSGGPGSWEDLALYLVARFAGEEEAQRIARIFVLGDRSDGQLPFSAMGRPRAHDDAVIGACQSWIAANYTESSPVKRMINRSGLAERTFKRRFKAATGYTPVDYVQALRIEEAKQILETTGDPVEDVALAVGYADPAFFRRLFKRRVGVTPARYRQRFRSWPRPAAAGPFTASSRMAGAIGIAPIRR
ncbi:GlxA family transcriptional regulator [Minwuia thermotolerans]|nr:helix-turn-helix domain-containing protein [Minwuia thermotolerans]